MLLDSQVDGDAQVLDKVNKSLRDVYLAERGDQLGLRQGLNVLVATIVAGLTQGQFGRAHALLHQGLAPRVFDVGREDGRRPRVLRRLVVRIRSLIPGLLRLMEHFLGYPRAPHVGRLTHALLVAVQVLRDHQVRGEGHSRLRSHRKARLLPRRERVGAAHLFL